MSHTPGPWVVEKRPPNMRIVFAGLVSGKRPSPCLMMDGDQEANGRLIAAAPELLEACQSFVAALDTVDDYQAQDKADEKARAAIAKALGK